VWVCVWVCEYLYIDWWTCIYNLLTVFYHITRDDIADGFSAKPESEIRFKHAG